MKICAIQDCNKDSESRGLCNTHYEQWRLGKCEVAWLDRNTIKRRDRRPFDVRFWERVEKTESCWFWTGSLNHSGYGHLSRDGKLVLAHRVAWELMRSPIPDGLEVCHHCDRPPCVNPEHLYVGTHFQNMQDMKIRRRKVGHRFPGELASPAKLTWDQVDMIRAEYQSARTPYQKIGETFGVCATTVHQIITQKTWKPKDRP